MAIEPFEGTLPTIAPSAFVAPSADLIGRVSIGDEASVWYNATLRGDINEIAVGPRSNVQDNAVLHVETDRGCFLGELVTVGHGAIVHACAVGDEVLVGMGSVILDGAVIGERSIIGANSLVTGNTEVPPGSLVLGTPARVVRSLDRKERESIRVWAEKYVENRRKFLAREADSR
jgi:carbonic anhydrase/acetyltransferase-like protein (isoleucine patch superfamily)